jgi:DNA-binding transcriptional regulator YdaS (Cro superfamily)
MKLSDWVEREGPGAMTKLTQRSGLAYSTVHRVVHDCSRATTKAARALSEATGGEVTIAEIRLPDSELKRLGLLDGVKPRKRRAA